MCGGGITGFVEGVVEDLISPIPSAAALRGSAQGSSMPERSSPVRIFEDCTLTFSTNSACVFRISRAYWSCSVLKEYSVAPDACAAGAVVVGGVVVDDEDAAPVAKTDVEDVRKTSAAFAIGVGVGSAHGS